MSWAVLAVAAVTAVAQAYQSEQARSANSTKSKQIKKLFDSIVPPQYDISIDEPPQYLQTKLKNADLDMSAITPEQFKVMGTYAPEAAKYVAEANPTLVQQTALGQEGRQSQIDALRSFKQIAAGNNPELQAGMERAARAAQTEAQSRSQSLLQDSQRRGTMGSGLSFASMLQGNSDSMLRGAEAGRESALEAYRSKLQGIQQSGSMGRQLAQDELGQQTSNADIINQFNQRTSRNYQDYENNRANLANQAQMTNLQNRQDIANKNVSQSNQYATQNQQNHNDLAQRQYANQRDERNYQDNLIQSRAEWQAKEKARRNALMGQTYGDQISRANGLAGHAQAEMRQTSQNALDRSNQIAGLGNAAGGYIANEDNKTFQNQQRIEAQKAEDARWDKYTQARRDF